MGLEAMTKTEMLEILRGKVLTELPDEIQARLNEIADELEQSERVVHGHWIDDGVWDVCSVCGLAFVKVHLNGNPTFNYCPNCGARMNEVSE